MGAEVYAYVNSSSEDIGPLKSLGVRTIGRFEDVVRYGFGLNDAQKLHESNSEWS